MSVLRGFAEHVDEQLPFFRDLLVETMWHERRGVALVGAERFARLLEIAFGSEAAAGATDRDGLGQLGEPG